MNDLTDNEIIESIQKGNSSDFSLLINRYKNKAFSLLNRMLKNRMDAEEALQDAFVRAFNGLSAFKQEAKFSTWFYKIAYNTALSRLALKNRKILNEMSSIDDHFNLESSYDHQVYEKMDMSEYINSLIEKLPPKYGMVITMFYLQEFSCEEIGTILNLTVPNIKVILHRSRSALKELMSSENVRKELI